MVKESTLLKIWEETLKEVQAINEEKLQSIRETILKVFPEERWDLSFFPEGFEFLKTEMWEYFEAHPVKNEDLGKKVSEWLVKELINQEVYRLLIHFPDIQISNSKNLTHDIKDIYFVVSFGANLKVLWVRGYRATLTTQEYYSGYGHSHMGRGSSNQLNSFCFGSGPLSTITRFLKCEFSLDNFQLMLLNMESYLSWESLSGIPYNKIENITGDKILHSCSYVICKQIWAHTDVQELVYLNFKEYFTPNLIKGKFTLSYNEKFEKVLGELLKEYAVPRYGWVVVGNKGSDGKLYATNRNAGESRIVEESPIIFKGERVMRTIYEAPSIVKRNTLYANKSITEFITSELCKTIRRGLQEVSPYKTFPESSFYSVRKASVTNNMAV